MCYLSECCSRVASRVTSLSLTNGQGAGEGGNIFHFLHFILHIAPSRAFENVNQVGPSLSLKPSRASCCHLKRKQNPGSRGPAAPLPFHAGCSPCRFLFSGELSPSHPWCVRFPLPGIVSLPLCKATPPSCFRPIDLLFTPSRHPFPSRQSLRLH